MKLRYIEFLKRKVKEKIIVNPDISPCNNMPDIEWLDTNYMQNEDWALSIKDTTLDCNYSYWNEFMVKYILSVEDLEFILKQTVEDITEIKITSVR